MPSSSKAYAQRLFCKVLRSRHFKNLKDIETNRLSSCSFGKIFDHKNWSIFVLYIIKLSRFQRVCIFSFLHKQKLIVVIIVRSYCLRLTHALSAYFTGFCPLGINAWIVIRCLHLPTRWLTQGFHELYSEYMGIRMSVTFIINNQP